MQGSSTTGTQPPPPNYLSARSADVILSEVRPTRIKSEALRSVNVLLDELLWLILGYARSFSTDRLRSGLLKALPTALGKNALLEAEVELRAYVDRNPPATPLPTDESTMAKFPLQPAFELLRMKCEAYFSLGDQEENTEAENLLHSRMSQIAGDVTPKLEAIAPASLYLTAILEHICEHVLACVGRVVARDSSRTTAHSQDLYVALCEDETIYALFKTMKVQDQIEQQSKTSRPRRSKSSSRNDLGVDLPAHSTPALPQTRQSMDSAVSNSSNTNLPGRSSAEKGRSKVIFKNSPPKVPENKSILGVRHRRSNSLLGDKKASAMPFNELLRSNTNDGFLPGDDDDSIHFDDLMRSGATMKVSLTPDRLKTFEVFAKEKTMRATRSGPQNHNRDTSAPPSAFSSQLSLQKPLPSSRTRIQVESIAEAPEGDTGRLRSASISNSSTSKVEKIANPSRTRSFTETRSTPLRPDFNPSTLLDTMPVATGAIAGDMPKRTRRGPVRNRESLDLDDVMDGIEDNVPVVTKKISLTPKSAHTTTNETKDLLDFLSEGPPEPTPTVSSPTSASFVDPRTSKQSRFRGIKNFLTGSSSNEKLGRSMDDPVESIHKTVIVGTNDSHNASRPSPPSLNLKRSIPNVNTTRSALSSLATPPDTNSSVSGLGPQRVSTTRKAVPPWESTNNDPSSTKKPVDTQVESENVTKALPRPSMPADGKVPVSPISPTRKRVPPLDLSINGHVTGDRKPSPTVSVATPSSINGQSTPRDSAVPTPQNASRSESRNTQTESSWPHQADDHVRDLRRLIAKANNADECRVLVDMFLAKSGALLKDETMKITPSLPPIPQIEIVREDEHELHLIEVLLGDGWTAMDVKIPSDFTTDNTDNSSIVEAGDPSNSGPVIPNDVPEYSPSIHHSKPVIPSSPPALLSTA
ncbi:hypothetical protein BU17DRAFT_37137 [Hysterangium stoloniferum]|nr:hypothetical protein BU17DRAFT_37137 [Hysterangium stoloniferum]